MKSAYIYREMSAAAAELLKTPVVIRHRPDFAVFERNDDEQYGSELRETNEEIERLRAEIKEQSKKISQISEQISRHLDLEDDLADLEQNPLSSEEGGPTREQRIQELRTQLLSKDLFNSKKEALEARKMLIDSTSVQLKARILEFESSKKRKGEEIIQGKQFQKQRNDHITQKLIVSSVTTLQTLKGENVMTAASWIRRWRLSLQQTGQNAYQKCTSTMLKLDANLKTMFGQIMQQGEIQWIRKNETSGQTYDVFTSTTGQQLKVKKGSIYEPNFDLFLDALLKKMLWSTPEQSILDAIQRQSFVYGTDMTVHSEKVIDLLNTLECKKSDLSSSEKARLYLQTMPPEWISLHDVPQDPTLEDAIQWAITIATKKVNEQKFLRNNGAEQVNAVMGEKFMFPSHQSVESSTTKTVRKEFNTADTGKFKTLLSTKNELDRRQQKEAQDGSESEEELIDDRRKVSFSDKRAAKNDKTRRKRKATDIVTTEDIQSILDERLSRQSDEINAVMQTLQKNFNRKATCSHCKYEDCFESDKPELKRDWENFVKQGEAIEGHYAGNCEKKLKNKHFKKFGAWCGKCKSYNHAYRVHASDNGGFNGDRNNLNRRGS